MNPGPDDTFIGLGANLGDAIGALRKTLDALANLPKTRVLLHSSFYRSAPVGFAGQPDFINAVARIETALPAREVLDYLHAIEDRFGRTREFRNAPRTLDLDLLLYGDQVIAEPGLAVPHPRMHERRFVLEPLIEITPYCVIPGRGPASDWLAKSLDQRVERLPT